MSRALRSFLERSRSAHPPCLAATSLAASFHSTPVLERKRRTQWHSRFNYYAKRNRKNESRRTLVRNLSDYAEYLFESWRNEDNDNSSREDPTWFRRHYWSTGSKRNGFHEMPRGNFKNRRNMTFDFCTSDEEEVDTIFQAAFRGSRFTYWSFDDSESSHWSSSGHKFHKGSRNWEYESDDETYTSSKMDLGSERRALGLSSSGPLKLEDVKSAYRECALRWHPDRHQGSSKVIAEEKFKHCSAAYKTLCDSLA